jgi:hypothetical protein
VSLVSNNYIRFSVAYSVLSQPIVLSNILGVERRHLAGRALSYLKTMFIISRDLDLWRFVLFLQQSLSVI